jgi:hypothetical protein
MRKILSIIIFIILAGAGLFIYWKCFYVFGDGVKSGYLNYIVRKGDVFKTWEGKLIQEGIRSKSVGSIQSYEFEFSVTSDSIANIMQMNSGKLFDLHYKEYHGVVAWRGYTRYIVDQVVRMREPAVGQ